MSGGETTKYANFERIPPEEQQRILDACVEEFARHSYASASTNAIVKRAGTPKGTLFYYFGSKKNLYLYVLDHAVERYVEFFDLSAVDVPTGLFERLLYHGRVRMQFAIEELRLYQLFFHAFLDAPEEIQAELAPRYAEYTSVSMDHLIDGLDLTHFREDIEVEKAVELVTLVLEGIYSRYAPAFRRVSPGEALVLVDQLGVETRKNFEMLKKGLYSSRSGRQ